MAGNRPSLLDESIELATRLPWWGGLLSALAAYVVLHPIAGVTFPSPIGSVDVAVTAVGQLLVMLARISQYVLPPLLLAAAAVSAFFAWKRRDLCQSLADDTTGTVLRGMQRWELDALLREVFRREGYRVVDSGAHTPEGTVDMELTKDGSRYLVTSRYWKASKLGVEVIEELDAIVRIRGADGGMVVISGQFTQDAERLAEQTSIELIDGRRLKAMVRAEQDAAGAHGPAGASEIRLALDRLTSLVRSHHLSPDEADGEPAASGGRDEKRPDRPASPSRPRRPSEWYGDDADMEFALGHDLTALIRDETSRAERPLVSVPPEQIRTEKRTRRPRVGNVIDGVGVAAALALAWLGYQWIAALPSEPAESPWDLLGTGKTAEDSAKPAPAASASQPATALAGRPLGEFQFGPRTLPTPKDEQAQPNDDETAASAQHLTVRELEAAFNATYIAPPECNDWASREQMVSCGNHRMRALREFVQSGGKMSAAMLGAPIAPQRDAPGMRQGDWRQSVEPDSPQRWREAQDLRQPDTWRQEQARREQEDPYQDQRDTTYRDQDWVEPVQQPAQQGWRAAQDLRQPQTWRQEQAWRDRQDARDGDGWAQQPEWLHEQDWRLQYQRDAAPDWRQGTSRGDDWDQDWSRHSQ